ncbi:phosphodiester glycosidase family protein [Streptomyces bohaiensis]|uniref:phosphodiester glycosidase family protein n=1 Tax=Streptomyces bohaiensis TaxID=1431344 RepID=UPI0028A7C569|nr:phosphodiester glycosidase family protein [Streptomyces bohaiensis]
MSGTRQPWRRVRGAFPLAATAVAAALAVGLIPPATAQTPSPDPAARTVVDGDGTEISASARPIAPGAELTGTQRLESDKWLDVQTLTVDLAADLTVDYLATADVADAATVGELAAAHDPGAGRSTVAAVNADFFDINATNAPLAPGIRDGELVQSGSLNRTTVVGVDGDGSGRVLDVLFDGKVAGPTGEAALTSYNAASLPADGIGVYTAGWGEADRLLPVLGAQQVTEVVVEEGRVTSVSQKPGRERVPADATVLLGRDAGAIALSALAAGDTVEMEYAARTADGSALPRTAVGGNGLLVVDGEAQDWEGRPNNATAPRTAVGFSEDGSDMYVVVVDGRQAHSGGVTLTELAVMMERLGAHSALNLDGGGSTTLLSRAAGRDGLDLVNKPSDGEQRPVPNGLALTAPAGGGEATGIRVATRALPASAPNGETMGDARTDRVLSGLTRQLDAHVHDATLGPAGPTRAAWSVSPAGSGAVDADGLFTGAEPGPATVSATAGTATGSLELTVLGEVERLEPTRRRLALSGAGDTTRFGLLGHDAAGYSAPVEPRDVSLTYDAELIEVEPDPARGGWTVRALTDTYTASTITARVGEVTTVLSAGVGLRATTVADFENVDDWRFSHARAAGELFAEPDGRQGAALGLRYAFDRSTGTRAAYATPAGGDIRVAGQPQSFTLWVRGDGNGAWPALHLKDADGTSRVLRGEHLGFIGWRQITFEVPDGFSYPAVVHRVYIAETRPDAAYRGEIAVDQLVADTPPDADLPDPAPVVDPLITTAAAADARDWRFALVSDAQFVARDPDSDAVAAARRTLREARASAPEFVVINGDWVDEGSPADLEFARTMIEEELGDLPWYYVPGNHEVMGGTIDQWEEVFGARQQSFDHRGTRFVTLDTSSLSISGGGYAQWRELREQLDAAAADAAIGSVVVVSHVPPQDPGPQPASRLTDRMDAWLLEHWLTTFREETGKGAAHLGSHVGLFDSSHHNGVPYLINGNAGKGPSAPPDRGGFSGWSTVGVDEVPGAGRPASLAAGRPGGPDWISVRTRPHVDGLTPAVPAAVRVGETVPVAATVTQGAGEEAREVPAAWPVSTDWSGSATVHVGDPADADRRHAAVLDPEAGTLAALRPGRVTVAVSVNGERAEVTVNLVR